MKTEMKKNYTFLITLGIVLLIAVLTNPDQERHREVIKSKIISDIQKSMSEGTSETDNDGKLAGQALGVMLSGALINGIVPNIVTIDNYVVFSTTKITWDGESKVVGVGAFGNVFLTKKLEDTIDKARLTE